MDWAAHGGAGHLDNLGAYLNRFSYGNDCLWLSISRVQMDSLRSSCGVFGMNSPWLSGGGPNRSVKYGLGLFVAGYGVFVLLATLAWIVAYFANRGLGADTLRASFGSEFGYWAPVAFFLVPGTLLILGGRRLMSGRALSLAETVELSIVVIVTTIVVIIAFL